MRLTFSHSQAEASNIKTFFFEPEQEIDYTAGQYIELTIKHPRPDERGIKHWFTLSSSPTDALVSITTKFSEPSSTFKKALANLSRGDKVDFNGPFGDFVLPKLIQTPLVFVAGGIGITPFHSILSWLIANHEQRPIKLIYGVKNEDEIIFLDVFKRADQPVSIVVENPSDSWGGEMGKLNADLILGIGQPTEDSLVYVSGPEPMVEALEKELIKKGIKKSQLVLDFFPNYTSI
ncbi:MAG TPA: FAD-dependent oxidoreductase [Candidatus Sulfotelmatobacter sp.]|nr:FAD-dependent oxidoreductase [Candidatus Sulfotelmatobacter sp.]